MSDVLNDYQDRLSVPDSEHRPDPLYLADVLPDWHLEAACRGSDPALFFPTRGASTRKAKEICAGCPVQAECLEWAIDHHEFGIWAGTSERGRRKIRRERAA